jgi:hypothetical protein
VIEVWSTTILEKGDKVSAIEGNLIVPGAASGLILNVLGERMSVLVPEAFRRPYYSGFFLEVISLDI